MPPSPLTLLELKSLTAAPESPRTVNGHHQIDDAFSSPNDTGGETSDRNLHPFPSFAMRFFRDFQRFCPIIPDLVLQLDSGERINVHTVIFYCCSAYCRQKLRAQQNAPNSDGDCWLISDNPKRRASPTSGQPNPSRIALPRCSGESVITSQPRSIDISVIRVPRVEYESLRVVVDFVYSGGLVEKMDMDSLPGIRFAATLLGIDELVTMCDSFYRLYQHNSDNGTKAATKETVRLAQNGSRFRPRVVSRTPSPSFEAAQPDVFLNERLEHKIERYSEPVSVRRVDHNERLPSVASVLAEIGSTDTRLQLVASTQGRFTSSQMGEKKSSCFRLNTTKLNRLLKGYRRSSESASSDSSECANQSINVPSSQSVINCSKRSHHSDEPPLSLHLVQQINILSDGTHFPSRYGKFDVRIVEYMKEDFVMIDKYVYVSKLQSFDSLLSTYSVFQISANHKSTDHSVEETRRVNSCAQQKHRHSLMLFNLIAEPSELNSELINEYEDCEDSRYTFKSEYDDVRPAKIRLISNQSASFPLLQSRDIQRFALLCHLDFSDKGSLEMCCKRLLINFIQRLLHKKFDTCDVRLDTVFCLKKSSGFKSSFRRDPLLSTSECYKALAEYSRSDNGELPLVLLSCKGSMIIRNALRYTGMT